MPLNHDKQYFHSDEVNITPIDQELDTEKDLAQQAQEEQEEVELKIKVSSRRDERHLAFYLLYAVDRSDYSVTLSEAMDTFEEGFECPIPRTSSLLKLVEQVIEKREAFDQQLTPHLKNWRLERLGCCTKLILHLAMAELEREGAIPSIVINEAVELAKEFAEKDAYKFINGVLDEMVKEEKQEKTDA